MAQNFSITFPKFWFDVQNDREITFTDKERLPFQILQDEHGHLFVQEVDELPEDAESANTRDLVAGLRIVAIGEEDISNQSMSHDKFEALLATKAGMDITLTFREEFEDPDALQDSSLGLGLAEEMKEEPNTASAFDGAEEARQASRSVVRSLSNIAVVTMERDGHIERIEDHCIRATSFMKGHEPNQCRLNGGSCWKPDKADMMPSITIDLGIEKQLTVLVIQGNVNNTEYCRAIWLDGSTDGAEWRSWSKTEIKLTYDSDNMAKVRVWPVLLARFIRIRPAQWKQSAALRMELLGVHNARTNANLHNARVITLSVIEPRRRAQVLKMTSNLPPSTKVIQVDCRQIIKHALAISGVTDVSFIRCQSHGSHGGLLMAVFSTKDGEESERVLDNLNDVGVGKQMGTISVMSVDYRSQKQRDTPAAHGLDVAKYKMKDNSFTKSVKSRKFVQTMIDRIMGNATLNFDYLVMLVVAAIIALGGLASNNAVVVVASMLVSPIMGPVMALTFGMTLGEPHMIKMGLRNECISLTVCIVTGFVVGLAYVAGFQNFYCWPTEQMSGRGQAVGLIDGAIIAAVSGVGVALCVMGDYAATIIGVAISASLLPPAVNCGMMLAFALYELLVEGNSTSSLYSAGKCPQFEGHTAGKLAEMAMLSFALTLENIVIIVIAAHVMFKIKKVVQVQDKNAPMWKTVTNFSKRKKLEAVEKQDSWGNMRVFLRDAPQVRLDGKGGTRYWIMEQKMRDTMRRESTFLFPKTILPDDQDQARRTSSTKDSPETRVRVDQIFGGDEEADAEQLLERESIKNIEADLNQYNVSTP